MNNQSDPKQLTDSAKQSDAAPAPANYTAASERPFASSPLVVSLLVVLLAAVLVQGALLLGIFLESGEKQDATGTSESEQELVVKPADQGASAPQQGPSTSPLRSVPPGSPLMDDFFSDDWQPFAEMARMRKEMDRLFDESFTRFRSMQGFDDRWLDLGTTFSGEADIREEGGQYIVTLQLPGADEATLDITLQDGLLSVSGAREEITEERDSQGNVILESRSQSTFQQSFNLPGDAASSGLTSDYKDGVLTIKIPKTKQG